ncbi:hypothetical protein CHU98_g11521 [Xylaria longipes]|nr:hypothetical protein CHU98_g11521 [Xylaria longipes]
MDSNRIATKSIQDTMIRIYHGIVKRRSAYLTDQALERLMIKCSSLDLNTGKPSDSGEVFITPFPTARIHEILEQTKPWVEWELPSERSFTRMVSAMAILTCLVGYLYHDENDEKSLIDHTDWDTREMQFYKGERLYRSERNGTRHGPEWRVIKVLDKMDGRTPHISCLLADDAPLRDHQLSNAEIWCILAMTYRRIQLPQYRNHIIPATVISASDRKIRIVQGYVDGREGCLRVRKSPILDFEQITPEQIELVLSWCIGETVGSTKL